MPSEQDIFRRAMDRLARVPPEVLRLSQQRIRGNLNVALGLTKPLPLPDATPADLTGLRRPFYIGGATALLCLFVVGGALVLGRLERRPASTLVAKSASRQTLQSQAPVPSPRSAIPVPPPVTPDIPKPKPKPDPKPDEVQPSRAATQPQSAGPPPVQARRQQARFTLLPPGEGKVILDRACGACHRAAAVGLSHYATRGEYAEVISRMIAMGAQVSEQEAPVLTDYLFDNLGPKTPPEVDSAGRAILQRACTSCHSLNGIESYSYDSEDPYRELVSTMVSYGATLSEAEEETLIRYLFTTYGKP
jgi:cytochrome c5